MCGKAGMRLKGRGQELGSLEELERDEQIIVTEAM